MYNIEFNKNYNLWELANQDIFHKAHIKFLVLKTNNAISEVFSIRVSADNPDDFNKASDFILEKLHKIKNILKINKKTLLNVIYEEWKTNILYWESIPTDKIPEDYSYEETISNFIKKLQPKNRYSYRKFITDVRDKKRKRK